MFEPLGFMLYWYAMDRIAPRAIPERKKGESACNALDIADEQRGRFLDSERSLRYEYQAG